jgi:hypothetical protein
VEIVRSQPIFQRQMQRGLNAMGICKPFLIPITLATFLAATSAGAITGTEVLKQLNRDDDQTLELPEVMDAAKKLFAQIDLDDGLTLEHKETEGRLTDADWRAVDKDNDNAIAMDEWLDAVRQRFSEADANKDGKLTVQELDSPAGQLLIKLIIK